MDAAAVVARLRELDARSGGRRVAWGPEWRAERERFLDWVRVEIPGADIARDVAGNLWIRLAGTDPETVVIGSHLDCVPDGGWLDGCLGVLAAAEVMRSLEGPRRSVALVDWADEEGSRFGHSLLGSSAACGLLDVEAAAALRDAEGVSLPEALESNGVTLADMPGAAAELDGAVAYAELHIEQGPVLDDAGIAAAAVDGCLGVRRTEFVFTGRAGHAGATPMDRRRDPMLDAARFVLAANEAAVAAGGLATIGALRTEPGTPTAIAGRVRCVLDLRHRDLGILEQLNADIVQRAGDAQAEPVWRIDPVAFDPALVERAAALTGGPVLTSGPLHDAAAVARAGVPTVMVFARTRGGVSHSREEDAGEGDLIAAIEAYGALVSELVE
ncbi:MAG: beta-ureidopropionase / N-carbamoyl-L-amino-acid hydrolase [Solirubrobacteraceae bacterium]|jgi:N-carbamoyl-L-amino-acid hydrolase|nr:beta-ureidopropionase / N-carbamoyl-L-amino-acid hydrolase [Solirubrobacteraceae bacterium]